jgi:hypothetical protein
VIVLSEDAKRLRDTVRALQWAGHNPAFGELWQPLFGSSPEGFIRGITAMRELADAGILPEPT